MHTTQYLDLFVTYREGFTMNTEKKIQSLLMKTHHSVNSQCVHP